jgi:diguanylate cyclase (GGDEF)-like protein
MGDEFAQSRLTGQGTPARRRPHAGDALWRLLVPILALTPLLAALLVQGWLELPFEMILAAGAISLVLLCAGFLLVRAPREDEAEEEELIPLQLPSLADLKPGSDPIDPLTGLPTFHLFSQRLLEEARLVSVSGSQVAVILVDINHLNRINEQFGPPSGDKVLLHLASCLLETKRQNDLVARMGDDEFGLILPDCGEPGARAFIQRLHERLARDSVAVKRGKRSTPLWIGICAGMAICDAETPDGDEALTAAVDDLNEARRERDRRRERWEHAG